MVGSGSVSISTVSLWHPVMWHHGCVEKAELVIESSPDDDFLRGRCSSCPDIRFDLMGNTLEEKKLLRAMFDIHSGNPTCGTTPVRRSHHDSRQRKAPARPQPALLSGS